MSIKQVVYILTNVFSRLHLTISFVSKQHYWAISQNNSQYLVLKFKSEKGTYSNNLLNHHQPIAYHF